MDGIRHCKKCGCELSSFNKSKLCESCKQQKAETVKKVFAGIGTGLATVGSVVLVIITKGKHGGNLK